MAGPKKLTGVLLDAFKRVERDLALLYGCSYFTEEQWIQIDFIIHQGQYVFTNGPKENSLIDFFAPLNGSNDRIRSEPETVVENENVDLLVSLEPKETILTQLEDLDDAVVVERTSTSSYRASEIKNSKQFASMDEHTAHNATNVAQFNYDYPYALDGLWKPGQDVHVTLKALKPALQIHPQSDLAVNAGDLIRITKNVSKHIFIGKNLATGLSGQLHEEIFHLSDRASVEAHLAKVRGYPPAKPKSAKMNERKETARVETPEAWAAKDTAQMEAEAVKERQRRLLEVNDYEKYNAQYWEDDDDATPIVPQSTRREPDLSQNNFQALRPHLTDLRTSSRASTLINSEVDSPTVRLGSQTPSTSASVSAEAAQAIAALRLELDARDSRIESRIQEILESCRPSKATPPTTKPTSEVCHYWAHPNKKCKFTAANCKKLHYYPEPEQGTAQPQRPQKTGRVNGKWASQMDPKSAIISSDKRLTCYFWTTKKGCTNEEEFCKFSHSHTGEIAPKPFWCGDEEDGEEEEVQGSEHGSSTSEDNQVEESRSVVESGGSGSDNDVVAGEELAVKHGRSGHIDMDVELGGDDDENDNANAHPDQHQAGRSNVTSSESGKGNSWSWSDAVNTAVEAPEKKTMILGAAAGGWGDESMEVGNDDGWSTVASSSKKNGKSDKVVW